ncbi:hypothetical protein CF319_g8820 [Tilletia indica]|nr:hypothetical protein CF319_g8820 [Tilletia indica]
MQHCVAVRAGMLRLRAAIRSYPELVALSETHVDGGADLLRTELTRSAIKRRERLQLFSMSGPRSIKKLKKTKKPTRKTHRVEHAIRARAHAASGNAFDENRGTMKITRNNKVRDASEAEAEAAKALMQSVTAQRDKIEKRRKGLSRIKDKITNDRGSVKAQLATATTLISAHRSTISKERTDFSVLKQNTSEVLKANLVQQHAKYNKLMTIFENEVSAHASTMATKQL